jgi:prepilin-type N-terminal cleavage/methylation domain-containing protein
MQDMTRQTERPRSPRGNPKAGFTLVEVIYVVILIGILAGIAAPALNIARFRMNSAVSEVATELMAAQRLAVLRGHDVVVAVDEDAAWLRVHLDLNNDGAISSDEEWSVAQLGEGVRFGRSDAPKMSPNNAAVTFTQTQDGFPALTFHLNGSTSERGFIYLTAEGGDEKAENTRAIEIIRSTAKVKCWSYMTGTWQETG